MENSRRPSMEPLGTLEVTAIEVEEWPSRTTFWDQLER